MLNDCCKKKQVSYELFAVRQQSYAGSFRTQAKCHDRRHLIIQLDHTRFEYMRVAVSRFVVELGLHRHMLLTTKNSTILMTVW